MNSTPLLALIIAAVLISGLIALVIGGDLVASKEPITLIEPEDFRD